MRIEDLFTKYPDTPKRDIQLLIQHVLKISSTELALSQDSSFTQEQIKQLLPVLQRRNKGEPVQRIIGEWEFWGLPFYLSEDTLVPRPDTETLIEVALNHFKQRGTEPELILDLGTGTGCIPISLLHEWKNTKAIAVDLSEDAIETAKRNAVRNNVSDRIDFIQSNWFEKISGKFDLILSNPPYIASGDISSLMPEVRNFDPILALDGGEDGLQAIHMILDSLPSTLKNEGVAFFEIGYDQSSKVMNLIKNSGLGVTNVHCDLGGKERVIEFTNGDKSQKKFSGA